MELISNVTKLPQKRLRAKSGLSEYVFSYDEKYVTVEVTRGINTGVRKYDLWRLIPLPATEQTAEPEGSPQARTGVIFLLAALVVFFSEFRWSLPLLVPVLMAAGFFELFMGMLRFRPRTLTHFFGADGPALVSIPMDVIEGDRESFIKGLSEAIQSSRTAVYGNPAV